nr:SDR family oxidoreductase [Herbiconiux flava]
MGSPPRELVVILQAWCQFAAARANYGLSEGRGCTCWGVCCSFTRQHLAACTDSTENRHARRRPPPKVPAPAVVPGQLGITVDTTRFSNRRVAITGGAGGIGQAIARRLVAEGAEVFALDRKGLEGLPEGVSGLELDLGSPASVAEVVASLYAGDDRPVDLVNSAGIVEDDVAAVDMPIEQFDAVIGVNLRGVFLTCQAFGRELMARGGGAIVNIASMSGNAVVNFPQKQSAYNTSKAAVTALTKSLAVEWGPSGVRVNALSPGYVDTPLNHLKAHMHDTWKRDVVVDRFATPEEVAGSVAFLLSDDASYYVGAELLMDGGYSLR